jgi:RNA polymerase sigma factor for flagellar operon FliA
MAELSRTERQAAREEARAEFRRAFERLSAREREVAVLLYVKNLTLREIGEVLDVSESRVSQIHSRPKRRIRERLTHDSALFGELAR